MRGKPGLAARRLRGAIAPADHHEHPLLRWPA